MTLTELNALPRDKAEEALLRCCGSRRWARRIAAARPFSSKEALQAESVRTWPQLTRADWLEAFSHHPRIGDIESLRQKFASTAGWANDEQKGARGAPEEVLKALAAGNAKYEERFGHVFLICATGKSAEEMLAALTQRLDNDLQAEMRIAADEQAKITALRLEKLIEAP